MNLGNKLTLKIYNPEMVKGELSRTYRKQFPNGPLLLYTALYAQIVLNIERQLLSKFEHLNFTNHASNK